MAARCQAHRPSRQTAADIAAGVNPQDAKREARKSDTLQGLFDRFISDHTEQRGTEKTRLTHKSRFDTCFADWKSRKLLTIREQDVRAKHAELGRTRGHVTANRAIQLLRGLFNWERIEPNPARKGTVDYFDEHSRERFLQADELPRFFKALEAEPNSTIRDYIAMSLYSGARRANVQSMKWSEVNLDTATWRIPDAKSKSGEAMELHLSEPALKILKARQDNGSEFVFPSFGKTGHIVEPKAGWARILKSAKISDLHLHDLRRSLGSWMASTGASLPVIGKTLGHSDPEATVIYARLRVDGVRAPVDTAVAAMLKAATAKPKRRRK